MNERFTEAAEKIHLELKEGRIETAFKLIIDTLEGEKTEATSITKISSILKLGSQLSKLILKDPLPVETLKELWELSLKDSKELVFGVKTGREVRLLLIGAFSKISLKNQSYTIKFIEDIKELVQDWETCDQLAAKVITPLILAEAENIDKILEDMDASDNAWTKRISIACIPPLSRKDSKKALYLLKYVERNLGHSHPALKKASGWALRELSKVEPEAVENFIEKHSATESKHAQWVLRDGGSLLRKSNVSRHSKML